MVKALKKKADGALIELFRSLFEEIDTEKLRREVDLLRDSRPDFEPRDHARVLLRRTAMRCAATGAISGVPVGVSAVAALGADLAYLIYQQFRMILGVATVYGREPSQKERFQEALACVAYGSGVGLSKHGLAVMLESATVEGGMIAEKIGTRLVHERLASLVPLIGVISGGALNYAMVRAVGRATIRYYESLIDPVLADEIWAEGDREHA
ncbi:MAG: EcsC family protein [Thermoanaerobaculia bacterium]